MPTGPELEPHLQIDYVFICFLLFNHLIDLIGWMDLQHLSLAK